MEALKNIDDKLGEIEYREFYKAMIKSDARNAGKKELHEYKMELTFGGLPMRRNASAKETKARSGKRNVPPSRQRHAC